MEVSEQRMQQDQQQLNALQTLALYGNNWRDSALRSSRRQSDLRESHDIFVRSLLGMETPPQHVLGLKDQVLSDIVVMTLRIASTERELYVRVIR